MATITLIPLITICAEQRNIVQEYKLASQRVIQAAIHLSKAEELYNRLLNPYGCYECGLHPQPIYPTQKELDAVIYKYRQAEEELLAAQKNFEKMQPTTPKQPAIIKPSMEAHAVMSQQSEAPQAAPQVERARIPDRSAPLLTCAYCKTLGYDFKRCSLCKTTYYCSEQCQKHDWPNHKQTEWQCSICLGYDATARTTLPCGHCFHETCIQQWQRKGSLTCPYCRKPYKQPTCAYCDKSSTDLKRCGRCKKTYYCSAECQRKDWEKHKLSCITPVSK